MVRYSGNTDRAIGGLKGFIGYINGLIDAKILSSEQGRPCIDAASDTLNELKV